METVVEPNNAGQEAAAIAAIVAAANQAADPVLGTPANPITVQQLTAQTNAAQREVLRVALEAQSDALDAVEDTAEVVAATTRVQDAMQRLEDIDP
ncbi:hypothetical protein ACIBCN_10810 [Nocardia sp. NPDC051052]|uniref:hypothetical protein n=1 Tax=Nocardia sp. NPDC051052 TaxID=3364322 RepID=UPI0037AAD990